MKLERTVHPHTFEPSIRVLLEDGKVLVAAWSSVFTSISSIKNWCNDNNLSFLEFKEKMDKLFEDGGGRWINE